jgi:GNAT superfamily N-acetyltransferase
MLTIRPPWPGEAPLLRALLPQACADAAGRLFLIARDSDGSLAGAISWQEGVAARQGVIVEVVPSKRRRGIGRRLVEALGPGELKAVVSEPATPLLAALGFRRTGGQTTAEADAVQVLDALRAWPEIEELQPGAVDPIAVALLYRRWISGNEEVPEVLTASRLLSDPALQIYTATREGRICAFLMGRREGDLATVEAWAAEPGLRGSASNAALLVGWVRQAVRRGARRGRVRWEDGVIQTPRLARRFGAREVGRAGYWTRPAMETPAP